MGVSLIVDANSYLMSYMAATQGKSPVRAGEALLSVIKSFRKNYGYKDLAVCFDTQTPCFRRDLWSGYKANRKPRGREVQTELDYAWEILIANGCPCYAEKGFEADDLIATFCSAWRTSAKVVIFTRDKDLFQLLETGVVTVMKKAQRRGSQLHGEFFTAADLESSFGVRPKDWTTFLALVGDSADAWPGAPGIGPKAAVKFINTPDLLTKRERSIIDQFDMGLALKIVTLRTDVPVGLFEESGSI